MDAKRYHVDFTTPHLKGIQVLEADEEMVTSLIGSNIRKCQVHKEYRGAYVVRTVLRCHFQGVQLCKI